MESKNNICIRCGAVDSLILVPSEGEEVCGTCGLIYADRIIDETYEKRTFSNENGGKSNDNRISGPTRYGASLGTSMVIADQGGMGKMRAGGAPEKNNMTESVFLKISKTLANAGVTNNVIEEAKNIYQRISESQTMKGRNLNCLIGALYFIASKKSNVDVTFDEVSSTLHLDISRLKKAHNFITKHIGSESSPEQLKSTIKNFIFQFANENHTLFDSDNKKSAKFLALTISENIVGSYLLEGRNPKTLAGLSLLIANEILKGKSNNNITAKSLSKKFVTKGTFLTVFEKIKPSLDYIIPDEYKTEIPRLKKAVFD